MLFHLSPELVFTSAGVGKAVATTRGDTKKNRIIGVVIGAIYGALLGAGTGVVGAFGGVPGWFVFALIGKIVGFFAVPDGVKLLAILGRIRKNVRKK